MLGGQIVPTFDLGESNALTVGATFEAISNPEIVGALYFSRKVYTDAAYVTNFWDPLAGRFVSDFRVGSVSFEWKNTAAKRWPVKVTVFFYKNFGAGDSSGVILPVASDRDPLAFGRGVDNDTAWFGRIQIGHQGPDVGSRRAVDGQLVDQRVVGGGDIESSDAHGPGFTINDLAVSGQLVEPLATDLDRRDHGRYLLDLADEGGGRCAHLSRSEIHLVLSCHLAAGIERRCLGPELQLADVALVDAGDELEELGAGADA